MSGQGYKGANVVPLDDPRLTIVTGREDGIVEIDVEDATASMKVLRLRISANLFVRCLSGLGWVKCEEATVYGPERLGMKHQTTIFEFPLGIKKDPLFYEEEKEHARAVVQECCPEGWQPDLSFSSQSSFFRHNGERTLRTEQQVRLFSSQSSFFRHNGERWARCHIHRWVPKDTPDPKPFVSVVPEPPAKKTRRRKK